jgi:putative intracellular protease/amidase
MSTVDRRQLGLASLAAVLAADSPAWAQGQAASPAETPAAHDLAAMPRHWTGSETIAFLIYPGMTALDMIGPHYMLTNLVGATTHIVAKSREPVRSDTGLVFLPDADFTSCPANLDILCVPGGTTGTLEAMKDEATLRFLKDRGERARFVTSVCTGSILLGAAGLLKGYNATSHWLTKPLLPIFGSTIGEGRVVRDRNRITGGGVTAGLDFGLGLLGELRDRTFAEAVQLLAEYAPEPPFAAGDYRTAPKEPKAILSTMLSGFVADATREAGAAFEKVGRQ